MRLLLVEDSERLQRSLGKALRKAGYVVDIAGDGEDGFWRATSSDYGVIILDVLLPKLDGLTLLSRLRQTGRPTAVLLLTARDTIENRVEGLQAGADDYLVKPFALAELLARVQALCRRQYNIKSNHLTIGGLKIDLTARIASNDGRTVELTAREFALLEYLALRRGHIVTRAEIENHLYGDSEDVMSNAVDSAVCALRKKLDGPESPSLIHTKRGLGYMLDDTSR